MKLQTINDVISRKIFRIPDYQRGYSWHKQQLNDFWGDLQNLQNNHFHYTGMISVKEASDQTKEKWKDEYWLIRSESTKPYFVVDGQQRLTTIIILLWCIANKIKDNKILGAINGKKIIKKFIFREDEDFPKAYLFGYEIDNPSFYYLIHKIFEEPLKDGIEIIDTTYTNNLAQAKDFFVHKLKSMSISEIEVLYEKVTTKLKFDYKELEEELDIFVVFETMNNRGKPLSALEKLKNRLIYLSTILPDETEEKRIELRKRINKAWQVIYYYLGRNKSKQLSDDLFLKNHWIIYHRFDRSEAMFHEKDIFEKTFTVNNVVSKNSFGNYRVDFNKIIKYVESIENAVDKWFLINNPSHEEANKIEPNTKVLEWLERLNRLGLRYFSPLVLAVFCSKNNSHQDNSSNSTIKVLKTLEKYIFLLFCISERRVDTGSYHFNRLATEIYYGRTNYRILKNDLTERIFGDYYTEKGGYLDVDRFYKNIKTLFDERKGYRGWKWLKYFLVEYETYLTKEAITKKTYDKLKIHTVGSFFDFTNDDYSDDEVFKCYYSLGNYTLEDKELRELIDTKKKQKKGIVGLGFSDKQDLYKESKLQQVKDVGAVEKWNEYAVLSRGESLIDFLESRWGIETEMGPAELLLLDFL